jgi:hypothetical protein
MRDERQQIREGVQLAAELIKAAAERPYHS